MLVLTRRTGESIIIGDRLVTIKVIHVTENYIKLGISAPDSLSVHRKEIYDKIKANDNLGNK